MVCSYGSPAGINKEVTERKVFRNTEHMYYILASKKLTLAS